MLVLSACAPMPVATERTEPTAPQAPSEPPPVEDAGHSQEEPAATPADPSDDDAQPPAAIEAEQAEAETAPEPVAEPETPADPVASSEPAPGPREEATQVNRAESGGHSLSGLVRLTGGSADASDAVVYFVPDDPSLMPALDSGSQAAEIVTRDKTLSPTVMAVPRGTEVRFPNEDPILHNLFSVSSENPFDLGVYGPGESPSVRLEQPGVVNIYCNVHHDMHAHVLVLDTPWRSQADAQGRFDLDGLPAGPGELHVWHRQSEHWSQALTLPLDGPLEISLPVTKPRLPPHRDKAGQSYTRRDRDPYR